MVFDYRLTKSERCEIVRRLAEENFETTEKFLAILSLCPAPESEYLDLADCVRLVKTAGPQALADLAKENYFLRSPKFESSKFWAKVQSLGEIWAWGMERD